jgi:uncharacterized protein YjiS (DUF1127 family)
MNTRSTAFDDHPALAAAAALAPAVARHAVSLLCAALMSRLGRLTRAHRRAGARVSLHELSARQLRDIGLTPDQPVCAEERPFWRV